MVGVERFEFSPLLAQVDAAVIETNKINDLHAPLGAACVQIGVLAAKSVTKLAPLTVADASPASFVARYLACFPVTELSRQHWCL